MMVAGRDEDRRLKGRQQGRCCRCSISRLISYYLLTLIVWTLSHISQWHLFRYRIQLDNSGVEIEQNEWVVDVRCRKATEHVPLATDLS